MNSETQFNSNQFNSIVWMIARAYNPQIQKDEADLENLNLEAVLSFRDIEEQLLTYYTNLSNEDLMSLSPNVHTWFLRRLGSSSSFTTNQIGFLIRAFLLLPHRLCRYLIASILAEAQHTKLNAQQVEIDEEPERDVVPPIIQLWERIHAVEYFSEQEKHQLSKELSRLLLDIQSQKSEEALDELHQAQLITESRELTFVQEERDYRRRQTSGE